MSRRPYTLKEMKLIVDFLVEHRAYAEVRGRKMWMDLANSKIVERTWQSLKETFNKRILPDIHNPYYKLTIEQISSFRQEYDVEAKNNRKLRTIPVNGESSSPDNHRTQDQASKKEDEKTGEDKCSNIQNSTRSSTDTLVLENYNENAEEIQKDLELSTCKSDKTSKSIRDRITYSEPLTPMLQEVIDDFASDDEPQLQIVEDPEEAPTMDASIKKSVSPSIIRESQSYNKKTESIATTKEDDDEITKPSKIKSLKLKKTQKGTWENKDPLGNVSSNVENKETNNNESEELFNEKGAVTNNTILTTDSQLPNNQEGLANKSNSSTTLIESLNVDLQERHKKKKDKSVKRSQSQSSVEHKKKKINKHSDASQGQEQEKNTQTFNSHPQSTILQQDLVNSAESIEEGRENCTNQNDKTDDTIIPPNVVINKKTAVSNEGTSQEAGPSGVNTTLSPADINPCLKSVSLYAENFSQTKNSDSEDEGLNKTKETQEIDHVTDKELLVTKEINSPVKSKDTAAKMDNMSISSNIKCKTMKDIEEVVLLKSHSDSDSEIFEHRPKRMNGMGRVEKSKQNAIANVFGFCSGAVSKRSVNRSKPTAKRLLNRHRLNSRNISKNTQSGSSFESTLLSDSDDAPAIDVRRGNHRRHSRIYPQPPTFDVLHQGNGGMCVIMGNKMYPLLLKENGNVSYCKARETSQHDDSDSYWKAKYLRERQKCAEERIRADELARLLLKAKEAQQPREIPCSPIPQSNETLNTANLNQLKKANEPTTTVVECQNKNEPNIKIKFGKTGEIEVEGQWAHVNPVLERMVKIYMHTDAQTAANSINGIVETDEAKKEMAKDETTQNKDIDNISPKDANVEKIINTTNAENSKPEVAPKIIETSNSLDTKKPEREQSVEAITIDEKEIHEKVDQIECEIFKEIEEIDKSDENIKSNESDGEEIDKIDENIKSNESDGEEIDKIVENIKSNESVGEKIDKSDENIKSNESVGDVYVTKRKRGRPKKMPLSLSSTSTESVAKKSRTASKEQADKGVEEDSAGGTSKRSERTQKLAPKRYGSDSQITAKVKPRKYKSRLSSNSKSEVDVIDEDEIRYMLPPKNIKKSSSYPIKEPKQTSPDNSSRHSDTTQGYQDSDNSPPNILLKRKKKMTTIGLLYKKGQFRRIKRKSSPYLGDDDSNSTEAKTQKFVESSASLNSEVYRSESYQLLLPKIKPVVNQLAKIDECPIQNETEATRKNFSLLSPLTINVNNEFYIPQDQLGDDSRLRSSEGNSSNVSLPLSPELSVVENLTVSKEIISRGLEDLPTINEIQANNNGTQPTECNEYLISEVDVSMPLMNQACELQTRLNAKARAKRSISTPLLSPINIGNVKEQSHTDSLHQKLRDLLLESAKKVATGNTEPLNHETMEIDTTEQSLKKTRAKKRCSTPRKKTITSGSKTPNVESVLEEHTESCSRGGRKSCPPIINIIPYEDPVPNSNNNNETVVTETIKEKKNKRKKDIIKVKILRPRSKRGSKESARSSRFSACTDSGINDTESALSDDCKCCDVSTDLVHNHSDTCLNMAECVSDSIEFIENTSMSIISVSSTSIGCETNVIETKASSEGIVTPEMFCTNALDATSLSEARPLSKQGTDGDDATVYHTPPSSGSFGSLITEDDDDKSGTPRLSRSKWYLFDEDETNFTDARSQDARTATFGSNLKQIFTNVFSVPNLSTITEMSKENESKPVTNTDAETNNFSHIIFEHDF